MGKYFIRLVDEKGGTEMYGPTTEEYVNEADISCKVNIMENSRLRSG